MDKCKKNTNVSLHRPNRSASLPSDETHNLFLLNIKFYKIDDICSFSIKKDLRPQWKDLRIDNYIILSSQNFSNRYISDDSCN